VKQIQLTVPGHPVFDGFYVAHVSFSVIFQLDYRCCCLFPPWLIYFSYLSTYLSLLIDLLFKSRLSLNNEKLEDTKGVTRRTTDYNVQKKNDRQYNGQKKNDRQHNGQKKNDRQYNGQKKNDRQYNGQRVPRQYSITE
jgi:hypothetical protein